MSRLTLRFEFQAEDAVYAGITDTETIRRPGVAHTRLWIEDPR
jgi:hypothetical protein